MIKRKPSFAEGSSSSNQRLQAAAIRAVDAHLTVRRKAERVCDEMDDITQSHGTQIADLSEDDSMVLVVSEVIGSHMPK